MKTDNEMQGGVMNSGTKPCSIQSFRSFARALILAVSLFPVGACAQTSTTLPAGGAESAPPVVAADVMRPYLGKWRPTSYRTGLRIGSLTISDVGISNEVGESLAYEFVRQTAEGVILRVTRRKPDNSFFGAKALAFSLGTQTVESFPPGGPTKTRELLWICYRDNLDQLASIVMKASCGSIYVR